MNTNILSNSLAWGDRTKLLPKAVRYALSLDFMATGLGPSLLVTPSGRGPCLRNVFGDTLVTTPDGVPSDVPTGKISWGDVTIGDTHGLSPSWISLRISVALDAAGGIPAKKVPTVTFESTGVISFDSGSDGLRGKVKQIAGSTFFTSRHESSVEAYRWLERRQLFGVGRFEGECNPRREWELLFSYDLYSAA